ncbi:sigma-70 family RNA polymerase sigma factor [Nitrospirillum sp. BR 11752]|uniref:sigma-70 family RNA polymerase sigma factor n=1 Tax=Nitrospirillum sp. BR 11752 TaxID=3104293 RepID=UPI002EBBCDCD|nr:sigma-70 family RNA polymerase sigma factor [Nitrospirillum sp. BR 11752]
MPSAETTPTFRDDLVKLIPAMRAFARSLTNNAADTDDLVQDAIVRAWSHAEQFTPGTNLRAWLFTILRNRYYSVAKHQQREVGDPDGVHTARLTIGPSQEWGIASRELKAALMKLPVEQREALVLVGGAGASYEEAAEICGCALGTIKSRVNRGRARLADIMGMDPGDTGLGTPTGLGTSSAWDTRPVSSH